jgi:DNA invertase Pin-like site-specific DNA recombinase
LIDQLRPDGVLVVWKLDRLSRSLKDLLILLEKVQVAGAGFQSATEAIDTTTPAGRMMMQIVGSFAEFERAMLRERTRNGLLAARQRQEVLNLVKSGQKTPADAARLFNVHPSTVTRLLSKSV